MNYIPGFYLESALVEHVKPAIRRADFSTCIDWANRFLDSMPITPFHIVSKLNFTNDPESIAEKFDQWTAAELARGTDVKSCYTETNGFAHNADQWHFHWFSYAYSTVDFDFEYLGYGWNSADYDLIVLTGMEELQAVYRDASNWDERFSFAQAVCDCMVTLKFAELIQRVTKSQQNFIVPLVAASHDSWVEIQFQPDG